MELKVLLASLIALIAATSQPAGSTEIYVDSNRGISNTTCCPTDNSENHTVPCKTLTLGLECVHYVSLATPVTLVVSEGAYVLTNDSSLTVVEGRSGGFAITGNCSVGNGTCVKIHCERGAGFTFVRSEEIYLEKLSFSGCGFPNNSTSKDFSLLGSEAHFQKVKSTLYFLLCRNITLSEITVKDTDGTGIVMYSTVGTNTITNSRFMSNKPHMEASDTFTGGGGVYIEFAYCLPGNNSCFNGPSNVPYNYTTGSAYSITNSIFAENVANVTDTSQFTFILPQKGNHLAFGRGGGLSIFFKGSAMKNSVIVEGCELYNNTALWGSGLFVEVQDCSSNNSVSVNNSTLSGNECLYKESSSQGTGGGGARLGFIFFEDTHAQFNSIRFENSVFSDNAAFFGGGVSFYAAREPTESRPTNSLVFVNTTWYGNVARAGSGADLSAWHTVPMGATATVNFTDCLFRENNGKYTTQQISTVAIGTLYLDGISVFFMGNNLFLRNTHSALAAISAGIYLMPNSSVNFTENLGRHGAGVALLGAAFIQTHPFSTAVFVNNSAVIAGGAIYQNSIGEHDLINSRNCFIRYSDITATPTNWSSSFRFSGNRANGRNESIFATSLLICQWGGAFGNSSGDLSRVFCWSDNWSYGGGNCTTEVRTLPAQFRSSSDFRLETFPGERRWMHLTMLDDRGSDVTDSSVFLAKSLDQYIEVDSSSQYISDNHIDVHSSNLTGNKDVRGSVLLETINPRVIQAILNITVYPCPPGMKSVGGSDSASCQCQGDYEGVIECNATGFYSRIQHGSWIGVYQYNGIDSVVASSTPYFNRTSSEVFIELPRKIERVDATLCGSVNRTGTVCGRCIDGFGPSLHTLKCVRCDAEYMWAVYLVSQYLPLTLLFLLVIVLDIRVTSPAANAFIFFAQVLPFSFTLNGGGTIYLSRTSDNFVKVYTFIYSIWSLEFFQLDNICLSPHISSLMAITITYLEAAYPLVLIGLVSAIVWMYERGFRCVLCICRPFHFLLARFQQRWNIRRSLIHTFASFVLLSYSRFILVSFLLLTTTPLLNDKGRRFGPRYGVVFYDGTVPFFSGKHAPFAILSILVLLVFALATPLLLIVPSLSRNLAIVRRKWPKVCRFFPSCNRCTVANLPKLNAFLEAFHGCYRDGTNTTRKSTEFDYRWCSGFYLVLRIALFAVYAFTPDWFLQYTFLQFYCTVAIVVFVILRPYKDDFYNKLDATMFLLLLGINTLTMYNYSRTVVGSNPSVVAFSLQCILLLLPLVYISIVVSKHLYRYVRACCTERNMHSSTAADIDDSEQDRLVGDVDSEGPLTQSGSRDYLTFMEQTGRLDGLNVYRPASTTNTSQHTNEQSPASTERDSGNCVSPSSNSSRPTPSSPFDSHRVTKSQEFESLPPSERRVSRGSGERVSPSGERNDERGGERVSYGSGGNTHGGQKSRSRNTLS